MIVGHSISSGIASIYAGPIPFAASSTFEGTLDIRPVAELIQRMKPILKTDRFAAAFEPYQQSMGFEQVPEPLGTQALDARACG